MVLAHILYNTVKYSKFTIENMTKTHVADQKFATFPGNCKYA